MEPTIIAFLKIYSKNLGRKLRYIIIIINIRKLRRIFGPKRNENGEWGRLHNEELHSLYRSPNVDRVIKSRRLRWTGHVARIEEGRSAFKILTGKSTRKRPLGRPSVDGRTILEWTLKR